jgi:hypothetical protein
MPFSDRLIIFESGEKNRLVEVAGEYRFLEKPVRNSERRRQKKFHQI